jgi:hypothetical protein
LEQIPDIYVIDLLPHFQKLGAEAVRCFQAPHDVHFSTYGYLVIAEALEGELNRLGLLGKGAISRRAYSGFCKPCGCN